MGGLVSRVRGAMLTRPFQRYNAEDRAQKVISREKPEAAPKFQSDKDFLHHLKKTNPQLSENLHGKDLKLHQNLQQVFVRSTDVDVDFDPDTLKQVENPDRPLPQKVHPQERIFFQSTHIFNASDTPPKIGKARLPEIEDLLSKNLKDPKKYSAEKLASSLDIEQKKIEDLLKHFSVFSLHEPYDKGDQVAEEIRKRDPLMPQPDWEDQKQLPKK